MENQLETINEKPQSLPKLMDVMDVYELAVVNKSINYGRQLQLQFKRLTKKRFTITKIDGVHPSKAFHLRRIA